MKILLNVLIVIAAVFALLVCVAVASSLAKTGVISIWGIVVMVLSILLVWALIALRRNWDLILVRRRFVKLSDLPKTTAQPDKPSSWLR